MTEVKQKPGRPSSSLKRDKDIKIKIANTVITLGESYEIVPKKDMGAPDGMIAKGTTKFLHEGNKEVRSIPYDENRRAWDTGFYPQSLCLSEMLNEDLPEIEKYVKYIKEPYEKAYKVDVSETNNEFWDKYKYELKTDGTFKTNDPKGLFDLFHALTKGKLCNPGEKDSTLQKANYCIKNITVEKTLEEERLEDKATAMYKFLSLLDSEEEKLYSVLEWIQMTNVREMDKKVIKTTFLRSFDNPTSGYDFSRRFLEGLEMYDTDEGQKRMEYFIMGQKLLMKNKISKKNNSLYLEGMLLGNTMHEIAQKALNNHDIANLLQTEYDNAFNK